MQCIWLYHYLTPKMLFGDKWGNNKTAQTVFVSVNPFCLFSCFLGGCHDGLHDPVLSHWWYQCLKEGRKEQFWLQRPVSAPLREQPFFIDRRRQTPLLIGSNHNDNILIFIHNGQFIHQASNRWFSLFPSFVSVFFKSPTLLLEKTTWNHLS